MLANFGDSAAWGSRDTYVPESILRWHLIWPLICCAGWVLGSTRVSISFLLKKISPPCNDRQQLCLQETRSEHPTPPQRRAGRGSPTKETNTPKQEKQEISLQACRGVVIFRSNICQCSSSTDLPFQGYEQEPQSAHSPLGVGLLGLKNSPRTFPGSTTKATSVAVVNIHDENIGKEERAFGVQREGVPFFQAWREKEELIPGTVGVALLVRRQVAALG